MNITTLKAQLPIILKHKLAPMIWGRHGVGKTSACEQFAKENGHYYVVQALGTKEVGDIQGLPDLKNGRTEFMAPMFVSEVNAWARANPDKYAIVHLDEINHINKEMQSVLFGALLGNRIGDVEMAPNVRYIASANPPTKDYPGVFDFKNLAMIDRLVHIELTPTAEEWAVYAKSQGVVDVWREFYLSSPLLLDPVGESYDILSKVKGSRRSAVAVAKLAEDGAVDEVLEGLIGSATLMSFRAYEKKRTEESVLVSDIIGRKKLTKKTEERLNAFVAAEQYGKLESLCTQLLAHFKGMEPNTGTQEDADRLTDLMMILPIDLSYSFTRDLCQTCQSINMKFDSSVNPRAVAFWKTAIEEKRVIPDAK